jgi:1-acyl-sn-glycerol-3-phosphate acyltransferase
VIPARKQRMFNSWFAGHARARIHGAFAATRIHGLSRTRELSRSAPVLVVSNHTAWWDPLVVLHVSQHLLETDGYALMDAKNLRSLPFFALVGAFGVDLDRPEDGAVAIKYAARLLDRPGRLCWIFPQGRERPITARPLGFRPGAAEIARVAKRARVVPAALRYEFGADERPFLYVSLGAPLEAERDVTTARTTQEAAVEAELARIERSIESRGETGEAFEEVHRASPQVVGSLATKLLSLLTRHQGPPRLLPGPGRSGR